MATYLPKINEKGIAYEAIRSKPKYIENDEKLKSTSWFQMYSIYISRAEAKRETLILT